jgi:hypothetical protein
MRETFLNLFQFLSKTQQKIWGYLRWYATRFRNVFPAHATIASAVGCHRDTVIEAIKRFSGYGWLVTVKRCFRSNLYFVNEELIPIDTADPRTFQREIPQPRPPGSGTASDRDSDTSKCISKNIDPMNDREVSENVQHLDAKKEDTLPHEVRDLPVSLRDKFFLVKYSLRILRLAIEDFKSYCRLKTVRNAAAFITSRCKYYYNKLKAEMKMDKLTMYPELLIN